MRNEKRLAATLAAAGIELCSPDARRRAEPRMNRDEAAPALALSYSSSAGGKRGDPVERAKALGLPLLFLGPPPARVLHSILGSPRADVAFDPTNSVEIGLRSRKLLQGSFDDLSERADPPDRVPALDWRTREVRLDGTTIKLTVVEMALLERLLERAGSPVTIQDLSQRLRALGSRCSRAGSMVAVYTTYLRRKLQPVSNLVKIRTVRRVGYCLEVAED